MKRNNYTQFIISSILCCVLLTSCDYYTKFREHQKLKSTITDWVGKKIYLPNTVLNNALECDKDNDDGFIDKKLIVYIDTTECTECRLHLQEWKLKINELKESVRFTFIVNPEVYDITRSIFCKEKLESMLFLDTNNEFRDKNQIIADKKYQVFLLDKNNVVQVIGNPIGRTAMWNLYKKQLTSNKE